MNRTKVVRVDETVEAKGGGRGHGDTTGAAAGSDHPRCGSVPTGVGVRYHQRLAQPG